MSRPFSRPWRSTGSALGRLLGVLIGAGAGAAAVPAAFGQSEVVLDPGAVVLKAGRLEFQFRSAAGIPADFEVWQAESLGNPAHWQPAPDATIDALAEGTFHAALPTPGRSRTFVRIRRVGPPPLGPAPVLNEVMSDNVSTRVPAGAGFPDWIEVYNPHDEAIALGGYGLSDDPNQPGRWKFPARILQPGEHLLVHAADPEPGSPPAAGVLQTDFGLRSSGETLVLSDPWGREVDRVDLPPLDPDQSAGRAPDGAARWRLFSQSQATPGAANSAAAAGVVVAPPEFSIQGGFHEAPVEVRLATREPGGFVRFTTDGTVPNPFSARYQAPLAIAKTTVVRATAYDPEGHASEEAARTYFVGVHHDLPVVSMAAPAANFEFRNGYLFGMGSRVLSAGGEVLQSYPFSGSNAWQDREVEVHLEMFEPDGRVGLRQRAGLKVYGGWGSRGYPQKSLALFARRQYGAGRFEHAVFPEQAVDVFESLVLRNSGNDNQSTHQIPPRSPITQFGPTKSYGSYFVNGTFTLLRDALMQRLLVGETSLDLQAYRPAVMYLNGEYWGLYGLREKLNEHHVLTHHGLPPGSIDLIEGYGDVRAGDSRAYLALRDFVNSRDLAAGTNFQSVADTRLEIDNFIDYHLAVVFFQNFDLGNIKCWRPRTPRGRFHWMVYDQDYGFNLWPADVYVPAMARDYADYANMFDFCTAGTGTSTGWPNAGGRTLLLRRLLAHPGFRDRFIRRSADLLNSAFRTDRVETLIGTLAAEIRPEIDAHLRRWSWEELRQRGYGAPYQPEYLPFTAATWETNLQVLVDFARARPAKVRADCIRHFGLKGGLGDLSVAIEPAGSGVVHLNSLQLDRFPWQGTYYGGLTNQLIPVANPGFRFRDWITPAGVQPGPALAWAVGSATTHTLVARFESTPALPPSGPQPRISEINYHAPADLDADDWIELHNPGDQPIDLGGWVVRDGQDDAHCLLPPVVLPPGACVVIARSIVKFQWAHPDGPDPIAQFPFGLDNGGETIRLFDPRGAEVLRFSYGDSAPWPAVADGQGSTLQNPDPRADPTLPASWMASVKRGGTPGIP